MIESLFLSGTDVFRLNFSHGEYVEKAALVKIIRSIEEKYNHPIAILADLQGPKLRVGMFEHDKVELVTGQQFSFDLKEELGSPYRVRLPHPEILFTLRPGDSLLLDDGKLRMKVLETSMAELKDEGRVTCEVVVGGKLSNKKGVNTPSIVLPLSPLTAKDRRDLEFILTLDVDWVALSFVQRPEDMVEFRSLAGDKVKLMAKLEKPSAIEYLEEIVSLSDGIMVARGDLGVEMSPWDVPIIQKKIVEKCRLLGKPVVIATQMMESMIDNPTPTRAEASDCATAVFESADAVMLSGYSSFIFRTVYCT
jgi:pyruvate kinase